MVKNLYNLKNRTAIVTGGAQGFGYAITKSFLDSGAEVIIWDIDSKMLERAINQVNSSNLSFNLDSLELCESNGGNDENGS